MGMILRNIQDLQVVLHALNGTALPMETEVTFLFSLFQDLTLHITKAIVQYDCNEISSDPWLSIVFKNK